MPGFPTLIGMVHLHALPGAPGFEGSTEKIVDSATTDAAALAAAGFPALMIENFGDTPFYADDVPKETVAAMAVAVSAVTETVSLPVGVNVLRNDAMAALAIAAATGAAFIRVNVLSGMMYTDQGPIVGRAAELVRQRDRLAPDVAIFADVFVKHATAPPGLELREAAEDLVERGGADAVIVSGVSTGRPPTVAAIGTVREAIGDTPLYVGSGVTSRSLGRFLDVADGLIVGTSIKRDGVSTNPVDPARATALAAALAAQKGGSQ